MITPEKIATYHRQRAKGMTKNDMLISHKLNGPEIQELDKMFPEESKARKDWGNFQINGNTVLKR